MPRRASGDETARLFLQLVNTLDRRSRQRDGTRLKPWDLDPVRVPALHTWAEIRAGLARLRRLVRKEPPGFRREWLSDHLPTLEALARLVRGQVPPLPEQVRVFYGLPARPAKESDLEELRGEIRKVLGLSRGSELRDAVEEWEGSHEVPEGEVVPTMARYLRPRGAAPDGCSSSRARSAPSSSGATGRSTPGTATTPGTTRARSG